MDEIGVEAPIPVYTQEQLTDLMCGVVAQLQQISDCIHTITELLAVDNERLRALEQRK